MIEKFESRIDTVMIGGEESYIIKVPTFLIKTNKIEPNKDYSVLIKRVYNYEKTKLH